jgi:hypothetical protein
MSQVEVRSCATVLSTQAIEIKGAKLIAAFQTRGIGAGVRPVARPKQKLAASS